MMSGVREDEEGQSSITLPFSASFAESILHNSSELREVNNMGFSDCSSSVDSSAISVASGESRSNFNRKATELRLGLPGSQSPGRDTELGPLTSSTLDEKPLFPLYPVSDGTSSSSRISIVSGHKRGFPDAVNDFSKGKLVSSSDINVVLSPRSPSSLDVKFGPLKESSTILTAKMKEAVSSVAVKERALDTRNASAKHMGAANHNSAPAPKAQVVGWPPIRSFRKNSMVTTSKNSGEVDGKAGIGVCFVKVSMDGAPYLRKVDIKAYTTYHELSSALEKMFSCFTIGHCTSHMTTGREMLSINKLKDLVHGSEYVLTYEDKDGDWMLVGDVPWEMFVDTCRRLRIMKSSDAIGLAPRAVEKCRNRS